MTVHHIHIGERPTLYCEMAKQLFGLNATADFIWRALADGSRPRDVQRALVNEGLPEGEAREFVQSAIQSWLNSGHLTPEDVLRPLAEATRVVCHVRIQELTVGVEFVGRSPIREFDQVCGQFSHSPSPPNLTISIVERSEQFFTFKDGQPLGVSAAEQLLPRLVTLLRGAFISSVQNGFLIHAAFVARRNRGVLLCGLPRAGKTTLCTALVGRGFEYCSDDLVLVAPNGQATGIPFAPAVKEGAWPLLAPYAPEIIGLPTYRRDDGQYVRYLPVRMSDWPTPEIACVLLLARQPGAATALAAVEPLEVVCVILESAFSTKGSIEPETLRFFARRIEAAKCYRIVYSEMEAAVRAVEELMHE
jgi:hypothetical protein